MLTVKELREAYAQDKEYTIRDSLGLFILVRPNGTKRWKMRFRRKGSQHRLDLGAFPEVGLAQARKLRDEARSKILQGIDPRPREVAHVYVPTFGEIADEWFKQRQLHEWSPGHYDKRRAQYELHTRPALGERPVDQITSGELFDFLAAIAVAGGKAEAAKRLRGDIENILALAKVRNLIEHNPATGIGSQLPTPKPEHFPAIIEPKAFGAFLRALRNMPKRSYPQTRIAALIAPHLALRPNELCKGRWDEVDFDAATWVIPSSRMKEGRDLVVPLSRQVLELLEELYPYSGRDEWIFPGARDHKKHMSLMTIEQVFNRLGYAGVQCPHGLRASFRTMAAEQLEEDERFLEMQVGHVVKDSNGTAYNRTAFLKQRVGVMQRWSDYLDLLAANNA